jgi:hypothetical protein
MRYTLNTITNKEYQLLVVLPYKHITIETNLAIDEAVHVLSNRIWHRSLFFSRTGKFEGSVSHGGFSVNRNVAYINSFLPYAYGHFHSHPNGTNIEVIVMLHPLVLVLVAPILASFLWQNGANVGSIAFILVLYSFIMLVFNLELPTLIQFLVSTYGANQGILGR